MAHLDQFPMFRLATLLARQLSSPIANKLKVYARDHPRFGQAVCARAGRWYRAGELRFKLWTLRLAGPRAPLSISDKEAIDVGTDILGEAIIFALGATIIIFEVHRQAMNKEAKSLDKKSRWVAIRVALEELKTELQVQQKEIDLLLAAIRELDPEVPLPLPSSIMKPLPTPAPSTASRLPSPPGQSGALSDALPIPGQATPSTQTAPSSSPPSQPQAPVATPDAVHPPGCTCVTPPPPPPPKPRCVPKPKPPPPPACR